ncbi:MAG: hypothetical protein Q8861_02085 [Bacteroidota bacterium]|nr:hypothetical protein [Bacteroidota bacterium]
MTPTEKLAIDIFSNRYGTNLNSRFEKLKEESDELIEAYNDYMLGDGTYEHVIDELGDVKAVLTHISGILQIDQDKLLLDAIIKSEVRQHIPNFKRKNDPST